MIKYIAISITVMLSTIAVGYAAPHISGRHVNGAPNDYVHKMPDIRDLKAMNLSPETINQSIGASGTKKIAVLVVGFPSAGTDTSGSFSIRSATGIVANLGKANKYFTEASYSLLNASFCVITTTFVANNTMSYYGYPDQADVLIKEIVLKSGVTSAQYNAVMLVHAGYGNESTSSTDSGDIWSAHYSFSDTNGFKEGLVVSELESGADPLGVWCHEFGHQLGLPDIYATDSRDDPSQVGYWELMDMGTWAGNGANPSHPGAWCKQLLGWVTPTEIASLTNVSLNPVESSPDVIKVLVPTADDPTKEYFLFEFRSKTSGAFDKSLPGSGVIIWHIDDSIVYENVWNNGYYDTRMSHNIINNSFATDHRAVSIVPADQSDPADVEGSGQNLGDAADAWPGTKTAFVTPDSDAFNSKPSGIVAAGFALSSLSGKMDLSVSAIRISESLSISKVINYPNPAGGGYPVSSFKPNGTLTTIAFHFTRPPQDISLLIYDISGEKVKLVGKSGIKLRSESAGPTSDYKWVYEYDWDGKNDSGNEVADGAYFYKVKADNQLKTGKLAIVR